MLSKFFILQTIGAGCLAGAFYLGLLTPILVADRFYFGPVIGLLGLLNLGMVAVRRSEEATWLSDMLPVVGLVGTVYAVLSVIYGLYGVTDIDAHRLEIFTEIGQALVSNFLGMAAYAWVRLTMKVCSN